MFLFPPQLLAQEEGGRAREFAAASSLPRDELEDEFEFLEEQDIVYSAAKHQQDIADSPASITVISREQIENTHCTDLPCLLQQVPELQVIQITPGYVAVGARALADSLSDKGLLLVDGQEMNVEVFGAPVYSALPVHMEDIERIEVVRGPGSALYGADAHSMVISIITRRAEQNRIEAFSGGGEHNRNSLNLRLDRIFGKWQVQAAAGIDTADHWRIRGRHEREIYRTHLTLERAWESSTSNLQLSWMGGNCVLFTFLGHMRSQDLSMTQAMFTQKGEWWHARVFFNLRDTNLGVDMLLFYRGIPLGTFPSLVPMRDTNLDGDLQFNWSLFANNLLISGVNYRWLTISGDLNEPNFVNQHRLGFYLQDEQRLWENLLLTAGIRFDLNSISPFTISPRLAAVWRFQTAQQLRLAFGQAFRKPSFFNTSVHLKGVKGTASFPELGEFFERSIGNEHLNNESISAFELGYRGSFLDNRLIVESDIFFNLYRDGIATVARIVNSSIGLPDLAKSTFQYENGVQNVNSLGGSSSLTYVIRKKLRLNINYTYRYSWYITDPRYNLALGSHKGDRVAWEPEHLLNASLSYLFERGLRLGVAVHARSRYYNTRLVDGSLFGDPIEIAIPAYVSVGGFASWHFEFSQQWMEIGLRVHDLMNVGFRDWSAIKRFDGEEIGGELQGRQILLYLRAGLSD